MARATLDYFNFGVRYKLQHVCRLVTDILRAGVACHMQSHTPLKGSHALGHSFIAGNGADVLGDVEAVLLIADIVDLAGERDRLRNKLESVQADLVGLEQRLANDGFVNNAPAEVVEKVSVRRDELAAEAERLSQHFTLMDG